MYFTIRVSGCFSKFFPYRFEGFFHWRLAKHNFWSFPWTFPASKRSLWFLCVRFVFSSCLFSLVQLVFVASKIQSFISERAWSVELLAFTQVWARGHWSNNMLRLTEMLRKIKGCVFQNEGNVLCLMKGVCCGTWCPRDKIHPFHSRNAFVSLWKALW